MSSIEQTKNITFKFPHNNGSSGSKNVDRLIESCLLWEVLFDVLVAISVDSQPAVGQ